MPGQLLLAGQTSIHKTVHERIRSSYLFDNLCAACNVASEVQSVVLMAHQVCESHCLWEPIKRPKLLFNDQATDDNQFY